MNGHSEGTVQGGYPPGQYPQQGFPQQQAFPQPNGYPYPQQGYVAPPAAPAAAGNTLSIVSIVLGAVALIILPPVFGIAGIVCATVGIKKGERLAKVGLWVSIAGLVLGLVLGFVVFASLS
ncbi:MAG: hypothetical protein AB7J32_17660 [Pseudonocardia sp.]